MSTLSVLGLGDKLRSFQNNTSRRPWVIGVLSQGMSCVQFAQNGPDLAVRQHLDAASTACAGAQPHNKCCCTKWCRTSLFSSRFLKQGQVPHEMLFFKRCYMKETPLFWASPQKLWPAQPKGLKNLVSLIAGQPSRAAGDISPGFQHPRLRRKLALAFSFSG